MTFVYPTSYPIYSQYHHFGRKINLDKFFYRKLVNNEKAHQPCLLMIYPNMFTYVTWKCNTACLPQCIRSNL